jgi:hypothetical protein
MRPLSSSLSRRHRDRLHRPPSELPGCEGRAEQSVAEDDVERAPRGPGHAVVHPLRNLLDDGADSLGLEVRDRRGSRLVVGSDDERRGLTSAKQDAKLGTRLVRGRPNQSLKASASWQVFDQLPTEHAQRAGLLQVLSFLLVQPPPRALQRLPAHRMPGRAQCAQVGPRQHAQADDLALIEPVQQRARFGRMPDLAHVNTPSHGDSQSQCA